MNIDLVNEIKSDTKVEFLTKDELKKHKLKKKLKLAGFSASSDSLCFLHAKNILACGIEDKTNDDYRSVVSQAIKALKSSNYRSASFDVDETNISGVVEGIILGGYDFNEYKSKPKKTKLKNIYLACGNIKKLQKSFQDAVIIAEATCFSRDIVNTIPHELNPPSFASLAKKLAKDNNLECKILDEKKLKKEKMGAMLAVGRASVHESQLIHLAYKPKNAKKVISLIGKGLTYDSGGLSLNLQLQW